MVGIAGGWRLPQLQILVGRLSGEADRLPVSRDDAVRILQTLTSFETFDPWPALTVISPMPSRS